MPVRCDSCVIFGSSLKVQLLSYDSLSKPYNLSQYWDNQIRGKGITIYNNTLINCSYCTAFGNNVISSGFHNDKFKILYFK